MEGMEPARPPVTPSIPRRPPPPQSPTSEDRSSPEGGVVTGLVIGFVASLLVVAVLYSLYKGRRDSRARAAAAARHAHTHDDDERQQPRRSSAAVRQPAFTYSPSVKHGVAGGGEETAAPCSVCLGALQLGEMVRLLPACTHLFHVECIDPWLDAHSTCPICRSDTDPSMDVAQLPPV